MELIIIVVGFILDRISKIWAINVLENLTEIVLIKDFFSFYYVENRGAAFGILQNKLLFLSVITFFSVAAMAYALYKYRNDSKVLRVSLSLIIAGALGNFYDRVIYKFVVDYILVHYKDVYYFPAFNIADMMVVVGTFLLAICIIKEGK